MQNPKTPERVFVSYSHDNELHKQRVLDLANRLREDGVDANLDQYEESPEQGWARWMEQEIHQADFVLIVGSKLYYERLLGKEADGVGLGAKWEGAILYQHLYESDMKTKGFVPVIFETEDTKFIPMPLRQFTRYQTDTEEGYEKLYRRITNQPKAKRPTLGKRRELSKPKVATSTMYVGGPINPDLWDQAQWQGTFFITGENPADGTIPCWEWASKTGTRRERYLAIGLIAMVKTIWMRSYEFRLLTEVYRVKMLAIRFTSVLSG